MARAVHPLFDDRFGIAIKAIGHVFCSTPKGFACSLSCRLNPCIETVVSERDRSVCHTLAVLSCELIQHGQHSHRCQAGGGPFRVHILEDLACQVVDSIDLSVTVYNVRLFSRLILQLKL